MKILQVTVRSLGVVATSLGLLIAGIPSLEGAGRADLAAQGYQARLGHAFEYRLSADGERVVRASGILSDPIQGDRVDAARRFFYEDEGMFAVGSDDVERAGAAILPSHDAVHVSLEQTIDGIRVMGPRSYVHYDGSGRVILVQNNFLPAAHAETQPRVSPEEAILRAERMCSEKGGAVMGGRPELVLHRQGDGLRLVYRVPTRVSSTPPKFWLVLVDAVNPGVFPLRVNMVLYAAAKGMVYPENADVSSLELQTFKNLKSPSTLSGAHVRTYNGNYELAPPSSPEDVSKFTTASESSGDYTFPLNDSNWGDHQFSEAMAYYHLDRAFGVLASMGFKELRSPMPIFVNTTQMADNAFYARTDLFPNTGFLATFVPVVYKNFAWDADIYYHEYGHAVLDHIQPAILERMSDYYGVSYHEGWGDALAVGLTGNPTLAEYALTDRRSGRWDGRSADNRQRYPDDMVHPILGITEPHYAGMIVAGAFWDLYKTIGARALQAFLDGNYLLDGRENFFGIRDAVVQAAEERDKDAVKRAFAAHGISGPDRGNPARLEILDVYTGGSGLIKSMKRSTFKLGEMCAVAIDARIEGAAPGYAFYGNLTISPPTEKILLMPNYFGQQDIEASNGVRSRHVNSPYLPHFIGFTFEATPGTYELTYEGHLGGTSQTFTRTMNITLVK